MSKTQPLNIKLPVLVECTECAGKRVTRRLFFEVACMKCNGLGKLVAETGEALPVQFGYPALMASIEQLRWRVKVLEGSLKQPAVEMDPYEGSGRYKGD